MYRGGRKSLALESLESLEASLEGANTPLEGL